jgi:hypothetical protein
MDNLKPFHTICTFVKELKELFGKEHHNIALYHRLLEKTPITNTTAINKHIAIFSEFLRKNVDCLLGKTTERMWDKIIFSKKIYINIKEIMDATDVDTRETIWKYLLSIHFYVFQTEEVRSKLAELLSSKPGSNDNERQFIDNFMNKIEDKFKDKKFTDPMSATQDLLKSGVFTEMVQNMNSELENGKIDIGRLLGTVQGMIGNLSDKVDESKTPDQKPMPDISSMFGMVQNMMGMMGGANGGGGMPDLGGLMSQLGNMSSMSSNKSSSIIEELDNVVDESIEETVDDLISGKDINDVE